MYVNFLSYSGIATMEKALLTAECMKLYKSGNLKRLIPKEAVRSSCLETTEPPDINNLIRPSDDATASRFIHGWLRKLQPSVAADGRLWTLLSHCTFAEYSYSRWISATGLSETTEEAILSRLFMKGDSMKRLFRNSIGRLWWFAHVCYDEKRPDPYELLPVLLSNQNIQSALLERRIGMCRNLLIAVLEIIQDKQGIKSIDIKQIARDANFMGGGIVLDCLSKEELKVRILPFFNIS